MSNDVSGGLGDPGANGTGCRNEQSQVSSKTRWIVIELVNDAGKVFARIKILVYSNPQPHGHTLARSVRAFLMNARAGQGPSLAGARCSPLESAVRSPAPVLNQQTISRPAGWRWCRKELAHICLHDASRITTDRDLAEIEAESVAFVVCNALGIDTASYSLAYVAGWSGGDLDRIRRTAERVVTTAQAVLAAMAPAQGEALAVGP